MTDTKIDLHVDPAAFLDHVTSIWTTTGDLGQVHSSQYSGYLWPMGPVFTVLHWLGASPWVAGRLWLGVILALSAWGTLRLMDLFVGRPRGVAHVVAAGFYVLNPYTAVFVARASVVLLGYAALPWLLIAVARGVRAIRDARDWRDWRGWIAPAAFALVLTSIGGGVNGAVVGWMLVGPLMLLLYEPLVRNVRWGDSGAMALRIGVLGLLASLWWIVPLLAHVRYGVDYLQYTEQPSSIWATNSSTEALRLMAYWTSYFGFGFYGAQRPLFSESGTLLFNPFAVGASLLLPALAVAGLLWSRRYRYAPFLLLVLLAGLAIEVAGFPSGTQVRQGMEWLYQEVFVVRFMRTTQKAGTARGDRCRRAPGDGGAAGLAASALPFGTRLGRLAPVGAALALAALIALAALPLTRGTAPDRQITWERIPAAWEEAGEDLDRDLPANSRAMVLPGQIFAYYRWGGTVDNILPRLTEKPVAVRYETPYSDPHASDLITTVDGLVQQKRLLPGQLEPLLRLMGVRAVISGSDDDVTRTGALAAAGAAAELEGQGLARPARSYGPVRMVPPAKKEFGAGRELPQVRRYDIPPGRGLVHVEPLEPATIVDGSAPGLAGLAAFGALPERRPIFYAGDLTPRELRHEVERGAEVVITDSNRRRAFIATNTQQNLGRTLGTGEPYNEEAALINPFPERGSAAETVAVLDGASYVRAPAGSGPLAFPEKAPVFAFDGDPTTMWTDRFLLPRQRWIEIGFERPRVVPHVDLLPIRDWRGVEREVEVNGVQAKLGPGVTRVTLDRRPISTLRVRLTRVDQPDIEPKGSGGFREIRIPGVRLRQALRPPVLTAQALAGRDLSRTDLTYLFERTTGDQPRRRDRHTGSPLLEMLPNRQDAEKQIERLVFAPEARSYSAEPGWPSRWTPATRRWTAWRASTHRCASTPRAASTTSARYRSSSAFDGRPDTSWVSIWAPPSAPDPWISWSAPAPTTLHRAEDRAVRGRDPAAHGRAAQLAGWTHPAAAGGDGRRGRAAGAGTCPPFPADGPKGALPGGRQRPRADDPGGGDGRARGARPRAGGRADGGPAARPLRERAIERRGPGGPAAAAGQRGRPRRRTADAGAGMRRCGAHGGGRAARAHAAGSIQRRSPAARLAGARPASGDRGRRHGGGPGPARQQLARRGRGGPRRARLARARARATRAAGGPRATAARWANRAPSTATRTAGARRPTAGA